MMSNALWSPLRTTFPSAVAAATRPQTLPAEADQLHPVMIGLIAAGLCVGVVWVVRCAARPARVTLRGTPGRPNKTNLLHLLAVLGAWIGSQAILGGLYAASIGQQPGERFLLFCTVVAQVVWFVMALVIASYAFRHGLQRGLGLSARRWLYDSVRAVLGYLTILPVCMGLVILMINILPARYQHEHVLLRCYATLATTWKAIVLLSAVVLAPLSEEMFFRGLLQSMVRRYTGRPWLGILVASAAFALIHIPYWQTLPSMFALAVALGYNYERTGRLYAPIVIHALFNAVSIAAWAYS